MMVLTANLIWLVAAVALMYWSRRSDGTGSGPYVRCPWCRMCYQACEPACPSCCFDDHPPVWAGASFPWDATGHDGDAADHVTIECRRVVASQRTAKTLRALVIARIVIIVVAGALAGWCIQTGCEGFDAGGINTLRLRYEMFMPLIGWSFYELTASCYLLGDGGATRQGPSGALPSLAARALCRGGYAGGGWRLSDGRRHARLAAVLAYTGSGVVSLALLTVMLYCGIFPVHPVTASTGQGGVTMRVLGIAAIMYAVNVLLLGVTSRAGFLVEQPQPGIPDGGWPQRPAA
ncbi:hypothetical protein [Bifidobacterium boum]|uniref:hypothetical protein n=1 Tax=Bifidobacterium boum TaxID=78343 RepID=UPI002430B826|nr:hypothetical protein [Bifidobacterium boum]MCI5862116.1 hypothetical protein [Bifidobacterium boum]